MPSPAGRRFLQIVGVAALVYVGLVGYIAISETRLVFPAANDPDESIPRPARDFTWDSLRVNAPDGKPVFLLVSRIDSLPHPWILFFHGNGSHTGSRDCVDRYRLFHEAGFNVLTMEFRGFGTSKRAGPPSSASLAADAFVAWNHLTQAIGVTPSQIAIYGWSLGGGVASTLAVAVNPAALITEGSFTSLYDIGGRQYPWLPVRFIVRNTFENEANARRFAPPWIVFHGQSDELIPFSHGEKLAAAGKSAKLVPLNGGHMDAVIADRAVALATIRQLRQSLAP